MRKVILHYHLFKNAGTSVDAALKENVAPEEWVTAEFPGQPKANREQVAQWILDNPQAKVFSSHTAYLPPPKLKGVKVLPVIFLRHPIDRIASVYAFEAKQGGNSFGSVLARNTDISGYVQTRLALPNDRQCRNFHVQRLSMMYDESYGSELSRAKLALKELPFIGLVEDFSNSIARMENWLRKEGFRNISLPIITKNASRNPNISLVRRLEDFEKAVTENIFKILLRENSDDLALYAAAAKRLQHTANGCKSE